MANQTPSSSNQSATNRPATDNKDALRQKDTSGRPSDATNSNPAKRQER